MSVFIAWSGQPSKQLAFAVRRFLGAVVQQSDPWMSEKDVDAGDRWDAEVETHLRAARFGVLCVTPDNAERPWLNYEAGAIANQMTERNRVCPLLLGLTVGQVALPLGRFQGKVADRDGVYSLVESINRSMDKPLSAEALADSFDGSWPRLSQDIAAINLRDVGAPPPRSDQELLEEVLQHVRGLSTRMGDLAQRPVAIKRRYWVGGPGKLAAGLVTQEGGATYAELFDREPNSYLDIFRSRRKWQCEDIADAMRQIDSEAGGNPHGSWHIAADNRP